VVRRCNLARSDGELAQRSLQRLRVNEAVHRDTTLRDSVVRIEVRRFLEPRRVAYGQPNIDVMESDRSNVPLDGGRHVEHGGIEPES
jgi:hypothetical protein